MTTAIPPDLPVSPGGEPGVNTVEDEKVQIEKKPDQSWVNIAKDKKTLKKYDVEIWIKVENKR